MLDQPYEVAGQWTHTTLDECGEWPVRVHVFIERLRVHIFF